MSLADASFEVIYANKELVIVNKPSDVRMDGKAHSVTVEKWALAYIAKNDSYNVDDSCRDDNSNGYKDKEQGVECLAEQREKDDVMKRGGGKTRKSVKFVHQLDYSTSGILCVAFSKEMAARLSHSFEMRTTQKAYLAILRGILPPFNTSNFLEKSDNNSAAFFFFMNLPFSDCIRVVLLEELDNADFISACVSEATEGMKGCANDARRLNLLAISLPVGKDPTDRSGFRMIVNGEDARESVTYVYVLQCGYITHPSRGFALPVTKVLLFPRTGRRHQLRVHCHALGFPILGDLTYKRIPAAIAAAVGRQNELATNGLTGTDTDVVVGLKASAYEHDNAAELWPRMMLHAWRLSFPFSVLPSGSDADRRLLKKKRRGEKLGCAIANVDNAVIWTHFKTDDPFVSLDLHWANGACLS